MTKRPFLLADDTGVHEFPTAKAALTHFIANPCALVAIVTPAAYRDLDALAEVPSLPHRSDTAVAAPHSLDVGRGAATGLPGPTGMEFQSDRTSDGGPPPQARRPGHPPT